MEITQMGKMIARFGDFLKDENGLTMVEYAVAGSLVTIGAVGAFTILGDGVTNTIAEITDFMDGTNDGQVPAATDVVIP